ncbi:MAG: hypothetical protein ACLRT5_04355 [Lachnospiraceae bacterium]
MPAVRAAKFQWKRSGFLREENLASQILQRSCLFGAVVPVEKRFGSLTAGTGTVIRDITLRAAADRTDLLAITFFEVRDEIFISPVLTKIGDQGKFVNFELLIFGGMGIIKGPLLKGDISTDKINQPAVLLVKILNN